MEDSRSEALATKIARIYYYGGFGVKRDYTKALLWTEHFSSDNKKSEECVQIIVNIYTNGGYGVTEDAQKALKFCFLNESCPSYLEAGEIYQFCINPPDYEIAFNYYQKALELGKFHDGAVS